MPLSEVMLQQCHDPDTNAPDLAQARSPAPPLRKVRDRGETAVALRGPGVDRGGWSHQIKFVCGAASAGRELQAPLRAGGSFVDAALARNPEEDVRK